MSPGSRPRPEKQQIPEVRAAREELAAGCLYVVATPLGNLEDITFRALKVLASVDLIAAEDTRHTRKLLTHFGIATPLTSYHSHNQESRTPEILARLVQGQAIALVSDAGTPGISDPGTHLADRVWEAGLTVTAVPGPAAVAAAVSMAGFDGDCTFVGFLPRRAGKRQELLASLAAEPRVLVCYESARRLAQTAAELAQALPDRRLFIVRELTKKFEQCWRGPVAEVARQIAAVPEIKGECTVVLSRPAARELAPVDVEAYVLQEAARQPRSGRTLAGEVAKALKLSRHRVYQVVLALKNQGRLPPGDSA